MPHFFLVLERASRCRRGIPKLVLMQFHRLVKMMQPCPCRVRTGSQYNNTSVCARQSNRRSTAKFIPMCRRTSGLSLDIFIVVWQGNFLGHLQTDKHKQSIHRAKGIKMENMHAKSMDDGYERNIVQKIISSCYSHALHKMTAVKNTENEHKLKTCRTQMITVEWSFKKQNEKVGGVG